MSGFRDGYMPITVADSVVTIQNTYSYYACKVYVYGVVLSESVTLRICIAYKKNGQVDDINSNDGQYSYMNRYVKLTGANYDAWGLDDQYITQYVHDNIEAIVASTYVPDVNEYPYVDTYQ